MSNVYNRGKYLLAYSGSAMWAAGKDIRVLLVTSGYTYSADHNTVSEVTASELSGGGYSRVALSSKTGPTEDDTNDRVPYDAADTTFTALGAAAGNPTQAIVYVHSGASDEQRELLSRHALTSPPAPNGGNYTIVWDSTGIIRLDDA